MNNSLLFKSNYQVKIKEKTKSFSQFSFINILVLLLFIFSFLGLIILLIIKKNLDGYIITFTEENVEVANLLFESKKKVNEISTALKGTETMMATIKNKEKTLFFQGEDLEKTLTRMKKENLQLQNMITLINPLRSSRILNKVEEIEKISEFVKKMLGFEKTPKFELLFQASRDHDTFHTFLPKIINKKDIIILIHTKKNQKFGGFLHLPFTSDDVIQYDEKAFLFSLQYDRIFQLNEGEAPFWIGDGMFFALGKTDIFISEHFFTNRDSFDHFPQSYGNRYDGYIEKIFTDGEENFEIEELEAFQLFFDYN